MARPAGSLRKEKTRSGKTMWIAEVEIGKKPNGQRIRKRRRFNSRAEALAGQKELFAMAERGASAGTARQSLDDYTHHWLRFIKAWTIKPKTLSDYEHRYRAHISPVLGKRRLESITRSDVFKLRRAMLDSGYSTPTVNGAIQVLKAVLRDAENDGVIKQSPAKDLKKLSKPAGEKTQVKAPYTPEEATQLFAACKDDQIGTSVALAMIAGLRRGEILGLKWLDTDLDTGTISITRTLQEVTEYDELGKGRTRLIEGSTKTSASARVVKLSDPILRLLKHRILDFQIGRIFREDQWVVGDFDGNPLSPKLLAKGYKKLVADAGLRQIRFHDLRHTSAHLGLIAGARLESVSQSLGHRRIDTTKRIYARSVDALGVEFSEKIGTIFSESEISYT